MIFPALASILKAPSGGGGFAPTDIAGLVGWWDASDASTITASSGAVSQWDDKSASGLDVTQATGSNQPSTGINTQNGLNVISFGSGDLLRVTPVTAICGSAFTIFFVFRKTGANNSFEAAPITMTAGNAARPIDAWGANRYITTTAAVNSTDIRATTLWSQISWTGVSGASSTFTERKDGAFVASGNRPNSLSTTGQIITMASRGDGVTKLTGDVAEIVVYDVELTGTDLTDVEAYLATKWGTA